MVCSKLSCTPYACGSDIVFLLINPIIPFERLVSFRYICVRFKREPCEQSLRLSFLWSTQGEDGESNLLSPNHLSLSLQCFLFSGINIFVTLVYSVCFCEKLAAFSLFGGVASATCAQSAPTKSAQRHHAALIFPTFLPNPIFSLR